MRLTLIFVNSGLGAVVLAVRGFEGRVRHVRWFKRFDIGLQILLTQVVLVSILTGFMFNLFHAVFGLFNSRFTLGASAPAASTAAFSLAWDTPNSLAQNSNA